MLSKASAAAAKEQERRLSSMQMMAAGNHGARQGSVLYNNVTLNVQGGKRQKWITEMNEKGT